MIRPLKNPMVVADANLQLSEKMTQPSTCPQQWPPCHVKNVVTSHDLLPRNTRWLPSCSYTCVARCPVTSLSTSNGQLWPGLFKMAALCMQLSTFYLEIIGPCVNSVEELNDQC
eukprot:TRINITY_DN12117_c0_g1_i1.p1 TRINITY_DN12117_c0_g1~~TRINITY_DN12117_c0_g1_i1.p1  ORF type:complete len:114 (-),score=22.72 TRINITY_DN12117_c0_g1_i1:73-414(-)